MPILSADYLFDGETYLPSNTVLQVSDKGVIEAIFQTDNKTDVEVYEGLLMPGMINAHCHLELSHMQNQISEGKGLVAFLLGILAQRTLMRADDIQTAIAKAEASMLANGIVAVGDISNTLDTLPQKARQQLHYQTFVVCLGLKEEKAMDIFLQAKKMQSQFALYGNSSLALHAPYTLSHRLIKLVNEDGKGQVTTIHNQECEAENELFMHRTGDFLSLFEAVHFNINDFITAQKNSLQTYLPLMEQAQPLILVHNTVTTTEDIAFAQATGKQLYWCLCPNANLYIEGRLPNIPLMLQAGCTLVLGTDSLASNHSLSIWDEIKTIRTHYPEIALETMLQWACINGAQALGMDASLGRFAIGKQPGVVYIPDFHHANSTPCKLY
ncbi:MAG TPA: amidohydrolase family protein [Chitinophagaceae bacterium]|nr:amidohydrolase family protein [Chitinophagaceae bacterium]